MNSTPTPQFLAGWYLRPDETSGTYDSAHAPAGAWAEAARWLHDQLNARCDTWGSQQVSTSHIGPGATLEELSFPNCRAFADWAVANRRGRGVLGFDGERYFYIIRAEGNSGNESRRSPTDQPPPLHLPTAAAPVPARA